MSNDGPLVFSPPPSPPPTPVIPETTLSTQERLRLAKRRRAAQLKHWTQRDNSNNNNNAAAKEGGGGSFKRSSSRGSRSSKRGRKKGGGTGGGGAGIQFVPNVMLLEAAARNDIEEVRRLLELGVSPDSTNEDGLTAMHQCCIDNSAEMMSLLVEHGGNPNATDTEKWTPLHAAATCGHLHLVKYLIDHGADLLAVNADGNMPYDLCEDDTTLSYIENEMSKRGVTQELIDETRSKTERKMLKDLQSAPAETLESKDSSLQGATPLHIAAANGYVSVVEFLLDNHVTTDSVDNDQWQPIHAAACWGHLQVVEILAQNGADISAKTKNGETPFDICEDPEIKNRLIQLKEQRVRGIDPSRVRRSGSSSSRTQSIRRTSLRDKMKVTKKDVREEKIFYMNMLDAATEGGGAGGGGGEGNAESSGHSASSSDVDGQTPNDKESLPELPPRRKPRPDASAAKVPTDGTSNSNNTSTKDKSKGDSNNGGLQKYTSVEEMAGPKPEKTGCCCIV